MRGRGAEGGRFEYKLQLMFNLTDMVYMRNVKSVSVRLSEQILHYYNSLAACLGEISEIIDKMSDCHGELVKVRD